jgi:hypothetical protein
MRTASYRAAAALLCLGAAIAVSGCSPGQGGPPSASAPTGSAGATATTGPAGSASPSPTATPSASYKPADAAGPAQNVPVPVKPALADEFSKAGIEAFATYWYQTLSYLYETGDSKPMDAITGPACPNCVRIRDGISSWYADGNWIVGGQVTVEAVESKFVVTDANEYQVIIQAHQGGFNHFRKDGSSVESVPPVPDIADILIASHAASYWTATLVDHR